MISIIQGSSPCLVLLVCHGEDIIAFALNTILEFILIGVILLDVSVRKLIFMHFRDPSRIAQGSAPVRCCLVLLNWVSSHTVQLQNAARLLSSLIQPKGGPLVRLKVHYPRRFNQ